MIGKRSSFFPPTSYDSPIGREASCGENGVVTALTPPQEDHPVDQLLALLGNAVQFAYTCWLSG